MFVERNANLGKYFWKVKAKRVERGGLEGDETADEDEITSPERHPSVLLYLSKPMFPSFTSEYGVLDKLKIVNLEKEIQIKM